MKHEVFHGSADAMPLKNWSVDTIITDPPYGMKWMSSIPRFGGSKKMSILGDDAVPIDWLPEAERVLKPTGAVYIFCQWRYWPIMATAVEDRTSLKVRNMIVLAKAAHGMGDCKRQYAPLHELVLYASHKPHLLRRPHGRPKDILPVSFVHSKYRQHPNQKNEDWVTVFIENSTDPGSLVLDPFCGSGAFLRAATAMGRRAIGIELDERFVGIARREKL